ncbi:TPA: hypothetical protein ACPZOD_001110 [Yersinia enterocolitica]|uniref:hypothetical protein n=1 Tax=Yersinia alsatica TaxID=2890317 RepID=UPI0011A45E2F|nr:hypothetical protein [Yersinia alsatica]
MVINRCTRELNNRIQLPILSTYAGEGTSWPAAENRGNVYSSTDFFGQHTRVYIDGRALAWDETAQFYTYLSEV